MKAFYFNVRPNRQRGQIAQLLFAALAILIILPGALYLYEISKLPKELQQPATERYPQRVVSLTWQHLSGNAPFVIKPISIYEYIFRILTSAIQTEVEAVNFNPVMEDGFAVAALSARYIWLVEMRNLPKSNLHGHVQQIVLSIWISNNWSAEEATSTYLAKAYFGHGLYGFRAAASAYFNLAPEKLTGPEIGVLLVTTMAPSMANPWCRKEQNINFA